MHAASSSHEGHAGSVALCIPRHARMHCSWRLTICVQQFVSIWGVNELLLQVACIGCRAAGCAGLLAAPTGMYEGTSGAPLDGW